MSDRIQVNAICRWTLLLLLLLSGWSGCDNAKDKSAPSNESSVSTLKAAKAALKNKEFAEAERLANEIEKDDKDWSASRFVAGEAATRLDRPFEAVDYYLAVKQDGSEDAYNALFYAADVYRHSGYLSPAMNLFQQVERSVPGNAAVHERLMTLYAFSGQRWRSVPHRFFLVRTGVSKLNELAELADLERPISYGDFLDKCQQVSPDDVLVKMAVAFHYRNEGFPDKAIPLLREIIAEDRSLVAAQASLGELILDSSTEEFLNWHAQLPPDADLHPDVWFVRGQWARRHDDLKTATRCYWQALQLDPSHRRATYQMGQALTALGETEAAAPFNERAQILIQMTQLADRVITSKGQDEAALQEMANLMVQTGRIWEACAWALYARQHIPNVEWPSQIFENWQPLLNEMLPLTHPDKNLAMQVDYSAFPTFEKLASRIQGNSPAATNVVNAARTIRFEEKQAGIDFVYFNGHDAETPGLRQFEQTGGGVGVLDYDVDGTPDVFLPQGSEWETGSKLPTPSGKLVDSLYRNQAGENGFVNVTMQTHISETGFGQGCSVGDVNNDGFPDLYVANVGRNALLINNGDGTFSESEFDTGDVLDDWTTSCLIMDLNSDGLPDLVDVNYVSGPHVYEMICAGGKACSPKAFDGTPDRVLISRGDGTFARMNLETPTGDSKGLGILAFEMDEPRRPSMFIANDQVPNFLLRNRIADNEFGMSLYNEAFTTGLAFNEDGLAMACMGIAADDIDGNGRTDLFVTNFRDESNTLYLQDTDGLFVDATNPAGLRAPSYPFVSWGTQFLDADRDGNVDVAVVSGDVDDYTKEGGQYHMLPQFFQNEGRMRFRELTVEEAGPYFGKKFLGRGLARLDWNQDGLMDYCVSNVRDPISLVTNVSEGAGHFVSVVLHATETARDPFGAVVTVKAGEATYSKQLVGGDGYMASNQRLLQFGLGDASEIEELTVRWPSGRELKLTKPPIDGTLELVEGYSVGTLWLGHQPQSLKVTP